jgi:hypothetical protein
LPLSSWRLQKQRWACSRTLPPIAVPRVCDPSTKPRHLTDQKCRHDGPAKGHEALFHQLITAKQLHCIRAGKLRSMLASIRVNRCSAHVVEPAAQAAAPARQMAAACRVGRCAGRAEQACALVGRDAVALGVGGVLGQRVVALVVAPAGGDKEPAMSCIREGYRPSRRMPPAWLLRIWGWL